MRKLIILAAVLMTISLESCTPSLVVDDTIESTLTAQEIQDLQFLQEEEKLARDVYLYALNVHNTDIFGNISESEQRHVEAISGLMNTYGVTSLMLDEVGVFSNSDLQQLYNNLTAQVDVSLVEALIVGATIEDLDIYDIDEMIENTDKTDILEVYEKLTCGSENHLRAYYGKLEVEQVTYEPQYLSEDVFHEILNGEQGHCGH